MSFSLYLHIPFCVQKCRYCDFISYPQHTEAVAQYLRALEQEMALVSKTLPTAANQVKTIFLGGGTPTCLSAAYLVNILEKSREYFNWEPDAEVTIEANPGTVDLTKLQQLREAGVNRLSLGAQAFQDSLLRTIGRIHDTEAIYKAVKLARSAGFTNLSLDLMYGLPGQSLADWQESLELAVETGVEHLSAYSLKLEPGTQLYQAWEQGSLTPCDQDLEADMYLEARKSLTEAGYAQYELSNFARPGWECRHNLTYWRLEEYLGLGPAAHSLMAGCRMANVSGLSEYAEQLGKGIRPLAEQNELSKTDAMAEYLFLGLRLIQGLEKAQFRQKFGLDLHEVYGEAVAKHTRLGLLAETPEVLCLTDRGILLANEVFADFL